MTDPGAALVVHKAARECPMIEPHRREICGLVMARETLQGTRPPTKP
ncbi:MAG: hypothetical protein M3Q93_03340 [Gemmatimonadota bacterium]|nr:hypothetical protein [Gemmatimonadota bacterium]